MTAYRDFTLDESGHWWTAPDGTRLRAISGGGSSGKTTVVNQVPAKTAEEIALIRKQNDILDIQISELRRQNAALEAIFPEQKKLLAAQTEAAIVGAQAQKLQIEQITEFAKEQLPLVKEQIGIAREQLGITRKAGVLQEQLISRALAELEGTPEEREIRKLSNERALAILRGESPALLPGQQERINTVFGRAAEEAQAGLTSFGEELAASRGMRVTDTPIGGELLRQGRELASSLAAAKAGAELNVGQTEQQFGEAVRQFQENLRQRAFQNRLALTGTGTGGATSSLPLFAGALSGGGGMTPTFATTTTGQAMAGAQGLLNTLTQERLAQSTQTTRTQQFPGVLDYVRAAASVAGAAAAWSSARLKKGILPLDPDEYDKALMKLKAMPVVRYRYRWENERDRAPHIGPILELSPEEIREDGLRINLLDYIGLTHAAVKAMDRKVERFGERLAAALEAA